MWVRLADPYSMGVMKFFFVSRRHSEKLLKILRLFASEMICTLSPTTSNINVEAQVVLRRPRIQMAKMVGYRIPADFNGKIFTLPRVMNAFELDGFYPCRPGEDACKLDQPGEGRFTMQPLQWYYPESALYCEKVMASVFSLRVRMDVETLTKGSHMWRPPAPVVDLALELEHLAARERNLIMTQVAANHRVKTLDSQAKICKWSIPGHRIRKLVSDFENRVVALTLRARLLTERPRHLETMRAFTLKAINDVAKFRCRGSLCLTCGYEARTTPTACARSTAPFALRSGVPCFWRETRPSRCQSKVSSLADIPNCPRPMTMSGNRTRCLS